MLQRDIQGQALFAGHIGAKARRQGCVWWQKGPRPCHGETKRQIAEVSDSRFI